MLDFISNKLYQYQIRFWSYFYKPGFARLHPMQFSNIFKILFENVGSRVGRLIYALSNHTIDVTHEFIHD